MITIVIANKYFAIRMVFLNGAARVSWQVMNLVGENVADQIREATCNSSSGTVTGSMSARRSKSHMLK